MKKNGQNFNLTSSAEANICDRQVVPERGMPAIQPVLIYFLFS
jgi:hypothetical protein